MSSQHASSGEPQQITIFYEILPLDAQVRDPAELQAVADETIHCLDLIHWPANKTVLSLSIKR